MRYVAFISYNHADRAWARWLHRSIEQYRIPASLRERARREVNTHSDRLAPVFLDREELSSSADLAQSVREALEDSAALIVVCSPNAARSRWVNEEIRSFKELGRGGRILCLIVGGDPGAADRQQAPESECFPATLRHEVVDGRLSDRKAVEPLAADVREGTDSRREALLKIVAGLLGVSLDEVRQRDQARRQRRLAGIAAAATVGCVVLAGFAVTAWLARNEAVEQRRLAVQKSLTAERTADFMVSLFRVSDPSEARGNSITAREILDRGVRQIDEGLRAEPLVRAELATTLGQVYYGLGLYQQAEELLTKQRIVSGQDARGRARQWVALADVQAALGRFTEADILYADADKLIATEAEPDLETRVRILIGRGDAASSQERFAVSQRFFDEALAVARLPGAPADVSARTLEGIAMLKAYAGDMTVALDWYQKALAERIRVSGETHPNVSQILGNMGASAYLLGDSERAESYMQRSIEIDRRVLGPRHPDVGIGMNNLGRLRLERRRFAEALKLLDEAVSILDAAHEPTHADLTFPLSNLALVHVGLGNDARAERLFERSLAAAVASRQTGLEGMILTYLADLQCRSGRFEPALARLANAQTMLAEGYPDDSWRTAYADNVRAGCLTGLKRYAEAEALVETSLPAVLARWPAAALYGHDSVERSRRLFTRTANTAKLAQLGEQKP
ncbi:MAG: toll/interleukin-1 receptor domain-containing protein [Gammaproteobacteria bacterium]